MRTSRPYRPALSLEEAIEELKKCSGTQFPPAPGQREGGQARLPSPKAGRHWRAGDPQVVEAFLKVREKKKPKLKVLA